MKLVEIAVIAVFAVPGVFYIVSWIVSTAYFEAKMSYQRRLMRKLKEEE